MKSTPLTMTLSLTVLCLIAGAALSAVRSLTAEPIARAAAEARAEALRAVLPPFDNDPAAEAIDAGDGLTLFPATADGTPAGMAVETFSDAGFSGRISLLVGFTADGTLNGYSVMQHSETPGLGARMAEWFRSPEGSRSVIGTRGTLAVRQDGGEVDAISGATITSRAFTEAINRARQAFENHQNSDK